MSPPPSEQLHTTSKELCFSALIEHIFRLSLDIQVQLSASFISNMPINYVTKYIYFRKVDALELRKNSQFIGNDLRIVFQLFCHVSKREEKKKEI